MGSLLRQTALVALALLVLVLVRELRALKERAAEHERDDWTLTAGLYVPSFSAYDARPASLLSETPRPIAVGVPSGAAQVILLFSADCEFSKKSLPSWNKLASRLNAEDAGALVGILVPRAAADSLAVPAGAEYPVVRFPGRNYAVMYRSGIVPQTVIVDSAGRVRYARVGVLETEFAIDSVLTVCSAVTAAGERRLQAGG